MCNKKRKEIGKIKKLRKILKLSWFYMHIFEDKFNFQE